MPQTTDFSDTAPDHFIVVGEDDIDDQDLLEEVFTTVDDSFRLEFVNSGREVISLLEKLQDGPKPCLIVLDYNMPELNGADILANVNRMPAFANVPKVIWSTSGSEKFKTRCLELGAVDYITKPSSFNALEEVVQYLISICSYGEKAVKKKEVSRPGK